MVSYSAVYKARLKLHKIPIVIVCCAILHNIAKFLHGPDFMVQNEEINEGHLEEIVEYNANIRRMGVQKRREISELIYARHL